MTFYGIIIRIRMLINGWYLQTSGTVFQEIPLNLRAFPAALAEKYPVRPLLLEI
jgi:hypothetical protein